LYITVGTPAAGLVVLAAAGAHANGRMANASQIVGSPVDPSVLVMETTVGLLVSHDRGATFGWVCEGRIGYGDGGVQDPSIAMTSGFVLAGLREGLAVSADQGCSWSLTGSDPVIDLARRRDDAHSALALTTAFSGVGDAGQNVFATHVLATHDDGQTWMPQGVLLDPTVHVETIDVAPGDPNRIYIGGWRQRASADGGTERVGVVLASIDGGGSYSATDLPLNAPYEALYGAAYVSAVDPTNPDRVYVRIGDTVVDRLVVSDDGAKTFATAYQAQGPLLGFALSGDGSTVFVGGPFDGVRAASVRGGDAGGDAANGGAFLEQSATSVSCLAWLDSVLYACVRKPGSAFNQYLGASTDEGVTFQVRSYLGCLSGPLTCPGSALATACDPGLSLLRTTVGLCPTAADGGAAGDAAGDAGAPDDGGSVAPSLADGQVADAGAAAGGTASSHSTGGCACGSGDLAGAAASALSGLSLLVALAGRRRSRARGVVSSGRKSSRG
jgi:hypothetical protein